MSYPQANHNGTQELNAAWEAFVKGDVEVSFRAIARITGYSYDYLSSETKKVAKCLLSYDYPALQQVTEDMRREFVLAVAWEWLFFRFPPTKVWDKANEPLATILGTNYVLNIDIEAMSRETYGEGSFADDKILPVPYEQRAELWPELVSLPTLSLAARKIFVRAMQSVQVRSGFVEYYPESFFVDHLPTTPEFDEGLTELAEAGLIDLDPSTTDLLMNLTLKDLKQFAFRHGIKSHGPKHRLIQAIAAQVGQEEIKSLLSSLDTEVWYIRPLVSNLPLLKKYVWTEMHRIGLYLEWVRCVHCLQMAPIRSRVQSPPPYRHMESAMQLDAPPPHRYVEWVLRPDDNARRWTRTEKRLVREVWDSNCDEIVRDLADKYAWDAPLFISDAIVAYLPSDKLEAFKQACKENKTRVWYNLLMYYGELRLAQMKVKFRKPRWLKCAGCGKQFLESSIGGYAEKVGYKIRFCSDCYGRVFSSYYRKAAEPASMSQDDMLNQLTELAIVLESIPSATFVRQPDLAAVSEEKQIAIVRALLAMPSYETYVEAFGSWLKALILAGVLEDGTQRTQRGMRCIAADGHECLSLAEKAIDDWLSAHNIPHEKEPLYPYHFYLNPSGRMRADWKVKEVLIEYAGLMDELEYAAKMETKQELAAEFGFSLIVIEPEDVLSLDKKLGRLVDLQ